MTLTINLRDTYETLVEKGPLDWDELAREMFPDQFCETCDQEHDGSNASKITNKAVRELKKDGYVTYTVDRRIDANPLEELTIPPEPLGAGLGDTYEGDLPEDKEWTLEDFDYWKP